MLSYSSVGAYFLVMFLLGVIGLVIDEQRWPRLSKLLTRIMLGMFALIFFGSMIGSLFESATGCAP